MLPQGVKSDSEGKDPDTLDDFDLEKFLSPEFYWDVLHYYPSGLYVLKESSKVTTQQVEGILEGLFKAIEEKTSTQAPRTSTGFEKSPWSDVLEELSAEALAAIDELTVTSKDTTRLSLTIDDITKEEINTINSDVRSLNDHLSSMTSFNIQNASTIVEIFETYTKRIQKFKLTIKDLKEYAKLYRRKKENTLNSNENNRYEILAISNAIMGDWKGILKSIQALKEATLLESGELATEIKVQLEKIQQISKSTF
ncbi:hypothetical protein AVEN_112022-1 [Araneus ventricosus]|uniref:Uncharacterized protein n=1 Tax=Araneus ventricosus TaxID=182803 RepID=A0A4Y2QQI6_ARAVE|nr:hypothetical protein AVEN_112022-1 [Araneus ventricosus]